MENRGLIMQLVQSQGENWKLEPGRFSKNVELPMTFSAGCIESPKILRKLDR